MCPTSESFTPQTFLKRLKPTSLSSYFDNKRGTLLQVSPGCQPSLGTQGLLFLFSNVSTPDAVPPPGSGKDEELSRDWSRLLGLRGPGTPSGGRAPAQVGAKTVGDWDRPSAGATGRGLCMAATGPTHLCVFLALWKGRELQLHVLHGAGPRAGGWGGRVLHSRPTLGLAAAAEGRRAGGAEGSQAGGGLKLTHAD